MNSIITPDSEGIYNIPSLLTTEGMKSLVLLTLQEPEIKFVLLPPHKGDSVEPRKLMPIDQYWKISGAEIVKIWDTLNDKVSLEALYDLTPRFYTDIPNIKQGGIIKEVAKMIADKQHEKQGSDLVLSRKVASGLMYELRECYGKMEAMQTQLNTVKSVIESVKN
nr:hypothetical protein K-LCC10_0447 [Kaumoebavirus]